MASRQMVHVGETVEFDLVLTDGWGRFTASSGIDEYAVLHIGFERMETEPDMAGHFGFSYRLAEIRPGDVIPVRASVFQQRGNRDFIKVREAWLQSTSPYEEPDRMIASDEIKLKAYQSRIELSIPRPPSDLDFESGVMRITRQDGSGTTVYMDRPGRPGFAIVGPEPGGSYRILYDPTGDDVSPNGTTRIEFDIQDLSGQRHEAHAVLDTP